MKFHLNDQEGGKAQMRANIDAWWPFVEEGVVEAIVMNASGCGLSVREYGHALREEPAYAQKAARISALTRDLSELLPELLPLLKPQVKAPSGVFAYHPPCTLQHGQKLRGGVEANLRALGFDMQVARDESHLCCGSAGTYSMLQPELAHALRDRKLGHLDSPRPHRHSVGQHGMHHALAKRQRALPVRHWVEVLDEALGL